MTFPSLQDPTSVPAVATYAAELADVIAEARAWPTSLYNAVSHAVKPVDTYLSSGNVVAYVQDLVGDLEAIYIASEGQSDITDKMRLGVEKLAEAVGSILPYSISFQQYEDANTVTGMIDGTVRGIVSDVVTMSENANDVLKSPTKLLMIGGAGLLAAKLLKII